MKTNNTIHLGDGAYAGVGVNGLNQIWLGANHHENMTVALGPDEIRNLTRWLKNVAPHIAYEAGL